MSRKLLVIVVGLSILIASRLNAQPIQQKNTPESLKALCEKLQEATVKKDVKAINHLGFGLMPDETRLKAGLRDNISTDDIKKIASMHAKFKDGAQGNAAKLFNIKPEQTEIVLHCATTEDLVGKKESSNNFPGGALEVAGKWLKPGVTYYQVGFVKPGEKLGMKYHLFYWDGEQWSMLGPLWRAGK